LRNPFAEIQSHVSLYRSWGAQKMGAHNIPQKTFGKDYSGHESGVPGRLS